MEDWHRDLIADPAEAGYCFTNDFGPFADRLAALTGAVLDIGGGLGVVRRYLGAADTYITFDPSFDWLRSDWHPLVGQFPCLASRPCFVRGIGESLPFPVGAFDVVLACWSVKHAGEPEVVFRAAERVLRLGGRFLVGLADMVPTWGDILPGFAPPRTPAEFGRFATNPVVLPGDRPWPLQHDHVRVTEADIQKWTADRLTLTRRSWNGSSLALEFRKPGRPVSTVR